MWAFFLEFRVKKVLLVGLLLASVANAGVLIESEGVVVTEADFNKYVKHNLPEDQRAKYLSKKENVERTIENLMLLKFAATKAKQNGSLDQADLAWRTDYYRDGLLMNEDIKAFIAENVKEDAILKAAKEEYSANLDEHRTKQKVSVSHILIKSESEFGSVEAKAKEILSKVKRGEDFTKLAVEYSEDPSVARNSGNLGYFGKGAMVKEFEDAAFALKSEGDVSELVKTQFGYHILKLNGMQPERQLGFEEVQDKLTNAIRSKLQTQYRNEYIENLKSELKSQGVNIYTDSVNKLIIADE